MNNELMITCNVKKKRKTLSIMGGKVFFHCCIVDKNRSISVIFHPSSKKKSIQPPKILQKKVKKIFFCIYKRLHYK